VDFFSTKLKIAGLTFLIKSTEKELIELTERRPPAFISKSAPVIEIELVFREKKSSFAEAKDSRKKINSGYVADLEMDKKGKKFFVNRKKNFPSPKFYKGFIDTKKNSCFFEINVPKLFYPDFFGVCIRVASILFLLKKNALLVHSSAVNKGGKCFLFVGPGGSGKTTIARLSRNSTVLNDDINILRKLNGITMVYGFPFLGKITPPNPGGIPLKNVFFVKKEKANYFTKLSRIDSVVSLLKNEFSSLCFSQTKYLFSKNFGMAADLLAGIDCYVMEFTLENDFWKDMQGL